MESTRCSTICCTLQQCGRPHGCTLADVASNLPSSAATSRKADWKTTCMCTWIPDTRVTARHDRTCNQSRASTKKWQVARLPNNPFVLLGEGLDRFAG